MRFPVSRTHCVCVRIYYLGSFRTFHRIVRKRKFSRELTDNLLDCQRTRKERPSFSAIFGFRCQTRFGSAFFAFSVAGERTS